MTDADWIDAAEGMESVPTDGSIPLPVVYLILDIAAFIRSHLTMIEEDSFLLFYYVICDAAVSSYF